MHSHINKIIKFKGFTLIEMAITLLILGVVLGATLQIFNTITAQTKIVKTQDRMSLIVQALSTYVQANGRLPCPGDPTADDFTFGWEYGVTASDIQISAGRAPIGTCTNVSAAAANNTTTGIIPFSTLGLNPKDVVDGWGRYFTYAVSPVFAQITDINDMTSAPADDNDPLAGQIHERCRTPIWIDSSGSPDDNLNAIKARFCCIMNGYVSGNYASSDINMHFTNLSDYFPSTSLGRPARTSSAVPFEVVNDGDGATSVSTPATETEAVAMVLVSHGPNGYGAFIGNNVSPPVRLRATAGSTAEDENADYDRNYVFGPYSQSSTSTFDDFVIWKTQEQIYAANGASSCHYP